ncbi:MAG: hypothetical protein H6836_02925 [Planctomycetes bacterium]|nr:hypothetical protein [Planctomycetota bacterium]MCB9888505.1 hypothetical protein [Planctomycetota bacterium]
MRTDTPNRRIQKWARRVLWVAVGVALLLFFRTYWYAVVPPGMDTMPEAYPPGTTCVIQRDPAHFKEGKSVILLEVTPGAAPLWTRVVRVKGDQVFVRHDNRKSQFCGYEDRGWPVSSVRGLVVSGFPPADRVPEPARVR